MSKKEIVFRTKSNNYKYASWLIESFKYNGYTVKIVLEKPLVAHNCGVLEIDEKKIILDWCDTAFKIYDEIESCDLYFKANLSTELINGEVLRGYDRKDFKEFIEKYNQYKSKIKPWVLGRVVKYDSPLPSFIKSFGKIHIINKFYIPFIGILGEKLGELFNRPIVHEFCNEEKKYSLTTYTRGTGESKHFFAKNRHVCYRILKRILGAKFNLVYIEEENAVYMNFWKYLLDRKDPLIEVTNVNFDEYLKLLSQSKFILNVSGIKGSNPFRCVDACLSNCCVISDKIYADSYKSFPRIDLPLNVQQGEYDRERTKEILVDLMNREDEIYNDLLKKQKEWFEKHLSMKNNCKQILRVLK